MKSGLGQHLPDEIEEISVTGSLRGRTPLPAHTKNLPGARLNPQERAERKSDFEYDFFRRVIRNLLLASVIALIPAMLAFGSAFFMWVSSGLPAINAARAETTALEDQYYEALRASQPLLGVLDSLGAPREQIESVYFSFEDANPANQRELADKYLILLIDQVNLVATTPAAGSLRAHTMIRPAVEARSRTSEAYRAWETLLQTPKGKIITMLWLSTPPSPGMAVYNNPSVRQLLPPHAE